MKQYLQLLIAILYVGNWSSLVAMEMRGRVDVVTPVSVTAIREAFPAFSEERLKIIAEGRAELSQGYGYKTANLMMLAGLTDWFTRHYPDRILPVRVPEFFAIASGRIEALLMEQGFNPTEQWSAVLDTVPAGERDEVLARKQLPTAFWDAQKAFIERLSAVFDRVIAAVKERSFNEFIGPSQKGIADADTLIEQVRSEVDVFMVRSTGKEDTRVMANAGGNESIANVRPDNERLWKAIKEVVLSYFGEKSLNQRLGLGDRTLFDPGVFCPVLVQRMIGERSANNIPVCGVMFTEEAEGGISYHDERDDDGRVKTTGITMVQAAYGHNTGVVNSLVTVDTVVAQRIPGQEDPVFYPIIRAKRDRLVPVVGSTDLQAKANPAWYVYKQSLSKKALLTLKFFADELERYYGYPMDVEFVIRDEVVYIVQARPIVHKKERKDRSPTYFADMKSIRPGHLFSGRTIVSFGGQIVHVNRLDECIANERVGAALDQYLKSDRGKVQCVFSGTDAPATSHEATTFRSEGRPVFYTYDIARLRSALEEGKKILFSPQQHCAVAVEGDMLPEIKGGWISYPLPRELSVEQLVVLASGLLPEGPGEGVIAREKELFRVEPNRLKTLLQQLKNDDVMLAKEAAQQIPQVIFARLQFGVKNLKQDSDLVRQLYAVWQAAHVLCTRVSALCDANAPLLERLLPINYLEALVYQQLGGERQLSYLSLAQIIRTMRQEQDETGMLASLAEEVRLFVVQLKKVEEMAFTSDTRTAWSALVMTLARESEAVKHLKRLGNLVKVLADCEIFSLWLHTTMVNEVQASSAETLAVRVEQWGREMQELGEQFSLIKRLKMQVESFDVGRFADPQKFAVAWRELQELNRALMEDSFVGVIRTGIRSDATSSQKLASAAACGLMNKFVEVFDTSIKALKGSNAWEKAKKLQEFKVMLGHYYSLLVQWVRLVPEELLALSELTKLADYLRLIDKLVNKEVYTEADLEPTPDVNATVFTLGSGHDWVDDRGKNRQPERAEDGYTIIHQSLLHCISSLLLKSSHVGALAGQLFPGIIPAFDRLAEASNRISSVRLVGLRTEKDKIEFIYNMPLGSHSLQIVLASKSPGKTDRISMRLNFFGGSLTESYRWVNAMVLFSVYASLYDGIAMMLHMLHAHALSVSFVGFEKRLDLFEKMMGELGPLIKTGAREVINFLSYFDVAFIREKAHIIIEKTKLLKGFGFLGDRAELIVYGLLLDCHVEGIVIYKAIALATQGMLYGDNKVQENSLLLFKKLFAKSQGFAQAIEVANAGVQQESGELQKVGFYLLYELLVDYEYAFDEAIVAAEYGILSASSGLQRRSLSLFKKLFEKRQGFAQAIEVAKQGLKRSMLLFKKWIFYQLLGGVIAQGVGFEEILEIAQERLSSSNKKEYKYALYLFEQLVEQRQFFTEADVVAQRLAVDSEPGNRAAALSLFEALVKHGLCFAQAIEAARANIDDRNLEVQQKAFLLFQALLAQRQAVAEAIDVIASFIQSRDEEVKLDALTLFVAIINQQSDFVFDSVLQTKMLNFCIDLLDERKKIGEVLLVARNAMLCSEKSVKLLVLALLEQLVNYGHGFEDANVAVRSLLGSGDEELLEQACYLLVTLVKKQQAFELALEGASIALRSVFSSVQEAGLTIFKELVKQQQYFPEALDAAGVGIRSEDRKVRDRAMSIFETLLARLKELATQEAYKPIATSLITTIRELRRDVAAIEKLNPMVGELEGALAF